jgi:hypothetical protein
VTLLRDSRTGEGGTPGGILWCVAALIPGRAIKSQFAVRLTG